MRKYVLAFALVAISAGAFAQEAPILTNEEFNGVAGKLLNPTIDYGRMKRNAEKAVRARLIDPNSGEFQWPYGFTLGTWKPFLSKRLSGYWTCGSVNAKNRMGGYVGSTAFVVVMQDPDNALFVDMDSGTDKFGLVGAQCQKSAKIMPPAPPEFADAPDTDAARLPSVADELAKLAKLRSDGILTQEEFDAQKAKLLGR